MKKIITICILIVLIVVISDLFIKNNIYNKFDYMIDTFKSIDIENNSEDKKKTIDMIESSLKENYLLMAFYIDHVELEKIKTQIVIIRAGIDEEDNSFLHEEIERTIFIIDHLKKKIDFKLENIL